MSSPSLLVRCALPYVVSDTLELKTLLQYARLQFQRACSDVSVRGHKQESAARLQIGFVWCSRCWRRLLKVLEHPELYRFAPQLGMPTISYSMASVIRVRWHSRRLMALKVWCSCCRRRRCAASRLRPWATSSNLPSAISSGNFREGVFAFCVFARTARAWGGRFFVWVRGDSCGDC